LHGVNRLKEAISSYDRALIIDDNHIISHFNKSITLLLNGDLERGFEEYEWRLKMYNQPNHIRYKRTFDQPQWLGDKNLKGCTIFIYHEQGLGDALQFCRYVKLVAALGARVLLEAPKALAQVMKKIEGVHLVVLTGSVLPAFDYYCSLMSLPYIFRYQLNSIPNDIPYVKAELIKVFYWQKKIKKDHRLKIGLVWSGGSKSDQPGLWDVNERRNLPFHHLSVLKDLNVSFYSLQKGEPAESEFKKIMLTGWDGPTIIDHSEELNDFSDTAGLVDNLDLVISVDTSTAHLAAAMGKPVWLLNRFDTCWRWLLNRDDSPWYSTVKIFRQTQAGNWTAVMESIRLELLRISQKNKFNNFH